MAQSRQDVAVVTGAASGIGAATTAMLNFEGVHVIAVDINSAALQDLELRVKDSSALTTVVADVSTVDGANRVVEVVQRDHGAATMLHNNAGVIGEVGPLVESTVENFDRLMSVNARSAYLMLREMASLAIAAGSGMSVVTTASSAALKSSRGLATYAMTKAALVGLTRTAAVELGSHNIRINAIAPGRVDTPLVAPLESKVAKRAEAVGDRPIARAASPEEIAELAVWLLSSKSSFVTGSIYSIDGGLTA